MRHVFGLLLTFILHRLARCMSVIDKSLKIQFQLYELNGDGDDDAYLFTTAYSF